ncbi:MAG: hypothetical protein AAGJ08_19360 [Cyanobacteria bacterium P01_H01_bin.35]
MVNRRQFILTSALVGSGFITSNLILQSKTEQLSKPGIITLDKMRPQISYGVASEDISARRRVVIGSRIESINF